MLITSEELSNKFVNLTDKLLDEKYSLFSTTNLPKANGMSYETNELEMPFFSPGTIFDLSEIGSKLAEAEGKSSMADEFEKINTQAITLFNDQELTSRYADYQGALIATATASRAIVNISEEIEPKIESEGWIDSIKFYFNTIKETIKIAFKRLFEIFTEKYHGLNAFATKIDNLVKAIADKAKNKIISAVQEVIQSLSMLFARIISKLFGWLAEIRTISEKNKFSLNEVNISLESMKIKTINIFGFAIPYTEFSTPTIEMKFK
jgi:hypothetical protein